MEAFEEFKIKVGSQKASSEVNNFILGYVGYENKTPKGLSLEEEIAILKSRLSSKQKEVDKVIKKKVAEDTKEREVLIEKGWIKEA